MKSKSVTAYQKQGDEIRGIVYTSDKIIDGDGVFMGFEHPVQNFFD